MRGLGARVAANLVWVILFSALVVVGAFLTFVTGVLFDDSYELSVAMPQAGGILPDMEVTVLGRAVGQIEDVEVTREGVLLTLDIDGSQEVPDPAVAQVLRRSPIGEQALDLRPTDDDWTAAEAGTRLTTTETIVPAPVPFLLEETVDLFASVEPDDVGSLVHELSVALEGRGERLRQFGRDSLELQATLVSGIPEFERLIDSSERVLAVLRDQRDELASAFSSGADLTEVFADQRSNLDALLDGAPSALDRTGDFVVANQANLECLMRDVTDLNQMLLGPSTYEGAQESPYRSKLHELERALVTHRYFFQQGFDIIGQYAPDTGLGWVRVLLVATEPQSAEFYEEFRPTPVTKPGAACLTDAWGAGVNAVRQPGAQPPHPTAPEIDYAPALEPIDRADDEQTRPEPAGDVQAEEGRPVGPTRASAASKDAETAPSGVEATETAEPEPVLLDTTAPAADAGPRPLSATGATALAAVGLVGLGGLLLATRRRRRDTGGS